MQNFHHLSFVASQKNYGGKFSAEKVEQESSITYCVTFNWLLCKYQVH